MARKKTQERNRHNSNPAEQNSQDQQEQAPTTVDFCTAPQAQADGPEDDAQVNGEAGKPQQTLD